MVTSNCTSELSEGPRQKKKAANAFRPMASDEAMGLYCIH